MSCEEQEKRAVAAFMAYEAAERNLEHATLLCYSAAAAAFTADALAVVGAAGFIVSVATGSPVSILTVKAEAAALAAALAAHAAVEGAESGLETARLADAQAVEVLNKTIDDLCKCERTERDSSDSSSSSSSDSGDPDIEEIERLVEECEDKLEEAEAMLTDAEKEIEAAEDAIDELESAVDEAEDDQGFEGEGDPFADTETDDLVA
jgi:hypothetical protein